jgi:hypothetical protein
MVNLKYNVVFYVYILQVINQLFFEILKTEICTKTQPLIFDPMPQYFYQIQFLKTFFTAMMMDSA